MPQTTCLIAAADFATNYLLASSKYMKFVIKKIKSKPFCTPSEREVKSMAEWEEVANK